MIQTNHPVAAGAPNVPAARPGPKGQGRRGGPPRSSSRSRPAFPVRKAAAAWLVRGAWLSLGAASALAAIQFEYVQYRVGEAAGSAWIGVVRDPVGTGSATVELRTAMQTATAGVDCVEVQTNLTFAPGEAVKVVAIPILNDDRRETADQLQVRLSDATGDVLGPRIQASLTIVDNDSGVRFSTSQVWAHEDLEWVELRVLRGGDPLSDAFTVDYTLSEVTAAAGVDFEGTGGTVAFSPGETSKSIRLRLANDGVPESDERFVVRLSQGSSGRSLGSPSAVTVTIVDGTGLEPRRFDRIVRSGEDAVRLVLAGGTSRRFQPFYGIYILDASTDLLGWKRLPLVGHPNAASSPPAPAISGVAAAEGRFFRLMGSPLISPDPPPSGPYPVGLTTRVITDATRRNRFGISSNATFTISVWYPAEAAPGRAPEPVLEKELAVVEAAGLPDVMDRLSRFVSYSTLDLPISMAPGRGWPVVLFSHGAGGFRAQNQNLSQDLASQGYVVIAPDHHDAFAVRLADDEIYRSSSAAVISRATSQDRVRDLIVVLDRLEMMNRQDPILQGTLDLGRVAAAGYSWGAPTAGEFCRIDPRCQAVLSLDWGTGTTSAFPELVQDGLTKPSLMMNAPANSADYLFRKAPRDAVWMQISRTEHADFVLAPWITGGDVAASFEVARIVRAYSVSFLNKYLQGIDDRLLDGASAEYPRVVGFRRK